jgi:hypothetical protein
VRSRNPRLVDGVDINSFPGQTMNYRVEFFPSIRAKLFLTFLHQSPPDVSQKTETPFRLLVATGPCILCHRSSKRSDLWRWGISWCQRSIRSWACSSSLLLLCSHELHQGASPPYASAPQQFPTKNRRQQISCFPRMSLSGQAREHRRCWSHNWPPSTEHPVTA